LEKPHRLNFPLPDKCYISFTKPCSLHVSLRPNSSSACLPHVMYESKVRSTLEDFKN